MHRLNIWSVTLEYPVRNPDHVLDAAAVEKRPQQRRRAGAVDVVISEDRDLLSLRDRRGESVDGRVHPLHGRGIRHERPQRRIEIGGGLVYADAPPRQHARQQVANAVPLDHGERARLAGRVEARPPGTTENGSVDVQKQAGRKIEHAGMVEVIERRRSSALRVNPANHRIQPASSIAIARCSAGRA